jgi:hypothetical protein
MPLMDDYYRQKAAANTGHKPIRDAIPNGTHVIQRTYGDLKVPVHRDAVKSLGRMPSMCGSHWCTMPVLR